MIIINSSFSSHFLSQLPKTQSDMLFFFISIVSEGHKSLTTRANIHIFVVFMLRLGINPLSK